MNYTNELGSWFITYLRDLQPTYLYRGESSSIDPKYQQDIPVGIKNRPKGPNPPKRSQDDNSGEGRSKSSFWISKVLFAWETYQVGSYQL